MDNKWKLVRGSKIKNINNNINLDLIDKKISIVIDIQLNNIIDNREEYSIQNKYSKWIVL